MRKILSLTALCAALSIYAQSETPDSLSSRELEEVVVTGERPQVSVQDGVMVVDLPGIVRDKPVSNVLEALGYLPGVSNNNGLIGLTGASSVSIILNGELTDMPLENLYQLLYSIPVDRLRNVEIMYSAPARYHIDGAVINVVLKTPSPLDGLRGQLRAGYNQAHYPSFGGGVAATYATGDWTFDVNYALSRTKSWAREDVFSNHYLNGQHHPVLDMMRSVSSNWNNILFASVGWKRLKLTYNGQITADAKSRNLSTGTLGSFTNIRDMEAPVGYHNVALRYSAPFGLTVGGDYTSYSEKRSQNLFKEEACLLTAHNRQSISRVHLYVDQIHQLGKWQLSYGAEYQHSDDHSSQWYQTAVASDFDNRLREDVASLYVGTQRSFDCGFSFNFSAKEEYFHNSFRHNWNFLPQLGATYYKTPKSIFSLNLSSQRIYPSYWELHGGTSHINDYSTVIGNPALQPYVNYSAQLSYVLGQKYVATLYLQYGDKATAQLPYQSPDALQLIYQTVNMDFKRVAGLNIYVPFSVGYVWNATATANIFNQREKADKFHDIGFDNHKWIFYGSLSNSFRYSPDAPVSLTVDFSYISPSLQGISSLSSLWRMDAGIKWQFGRKRCCEIDLKAEDIFGRWSPVMTIDHAGQDFRMKVRDMTRNLKVTFVWRFNGFKPVENAVDTSRFGTGK